ncbi:uncharacterized protein LOC125654532 [Ostrea edulis]|uniref:uncharacterized protein LOC125654532 n=1 Tax=Ostrea edulis TaxID=37623 RepID=UPI0024AF806F|nr:uncharacterized protein LOC125654532 [Ostrea edulis]
MYLLQILLTTVYFVSVGGVPPSCKERELIGNCCPNSYYNTTAKECKICPNGFIGINCSEKCQDNFHGRECQKTCPRHCQGLCHHITGECPHQVTTTLWTTPLFDKSHISTIEHRNRRMSTTNNIQTKEASLERSTYTTHMTSHTIHAKSIEISNKFLREEKSTFPVIVPIVCFGSTLVGLLFIIFMIHVVRTYKTHRSSQLQEVDVQTQFNSVYDLINEDCMQITSTGGCDTAKNG